MGFDLLSVSTMQSAIRKATKLESDSSILDLIRSFKFDESRLQNVCSYVDPNGEVSYSDYATLIRRESKEKLLLHYEYAYWIKIWTLLYALELISEDEYEKGKLNDGFSFSENTCRFISDGLLPYFCLNQSKIDKMVKLSEPYSKSWQESYSRIISATCAVHHLGQNEIATITHAKDVIIESIHLMEIATFCHFSCGFRIT